MVSASKVSMAVVATSFVATGNSNTAVALPIKSGAELTSGSSASNSKVDDTKLCQGGDPVKLEKLKAKSLWTQNTGYEENSCQHPKLWENSDFGGQGCEGDPTSIVIQSTKSLDAECLKATMGGCDFTIERMKEIAQIDFDFTEADCSGVWAAPLWLNPDAWGEGDGGNSGEMDFLENCPISNKAISSNWAYGAKQVNWGDAKGYMAENFTGHVTVRFEKGIVSVDVCERDNGKAGKTCPKTEQAAVYPSCPGEGGAGCFGEKTAANPGHWWDSRGGKSDKPYHLISDIWNGTKGDAGYQGCMGCDKDCAKKNNGCSTSIEKIRVTWSDPNYKNKFNDDDKNKCSVLNKN
jgi:hypothetical protein